MCSTAALITTFTASEHQHGKLTVLYFEVHLSIAVLCNTMHSCHIVILTYTCCAVHAYFLARDHICELTGPWVCVQSVDAAGL
jgi:hypothetical protein